MKDKNEIGETPQQKKIAVLKKCPPSPPNEKNIFLCWWSELEHPLHLSPFFSVFSNLKKCQIKTDNKKTKNKTWTGIKR